MSIKPKVFERLQTVLEAKGRMIKEQMQAQK